MLETDDAVQTDPNPRIAVSAVGVTVVYTRLQADCQYAVLFANRTSDAVTLHFSAAFARAGADGKWLPERVTAGGEELEASESGLYTVTLGANDTALVRAHYVSPVQGVGLVVPLALFGDWAGRVDRVSVSLYLPDGHTGWLTNRSSRTPDDALRSDGSVQWTLRDGQRPQDLTIGIMIPDEAVLAALSGARPDLCAQYRAGRYEEALRLIDDLLEAGAGNSEDMLRYLAVKCYAALGRNAELIGAADALLSEKSLSGNADRSDAQGGLGE